MSLLDTVAQNLATDPARWPDKRGDYHADCPYCGKPAKKGQVHFRISPDGLCYCQVCQAGTSLSALADHLGIKAERNGSIPQTVYPYYSADGVLLYEVVRYYKGKEKSFFQRHPNADGDMVNGMNGVERVLYRLPELLSRPPSTPVYIVEGEKDVEMLRMRGLVATTNVGGAGKWQAGYSAWLKNADVIILPDNDQVGEQHAQTVYQSLQSVAHSAKIVRLPNLPDKGDVSDWIVAGHTITELEALVNASDHTSAEPVITPPRFTVAREDALMDLPPVRYLDRELGLVAKSFHLIYGASGSGKTFFAIERAMRQVSLGRRVLYIPTEDVQGLRYRIVAWRIAHPDVAGHLTWLQMPVGLDLQDHSQVAELIEAVQPYEYDHIIIDTLREAHSGDENSSQDTRRINRAIQSLVVTGAAVDVVHHTGVAGERPRGSTALFGNADAVIKVEDDDGYVRVSFEKLRNAPPRDALAFGMVQQDTGLVDTDGEPVISVILRSADQTTQRGTKLSPIQKDVLRTLALSIFDGIGAKAQQVIDTSGVTRRNVYLALASLKTRGYVWQGSKGDPYTITPSGRTVLNDPVKSPASDRGFKASNKPSDQSDQQVISSDQRTTSNEVITSDHTRRVITRSHTRTTDIDHTSTDDLFSDQAPDGLTAEQWEQAQYYHAIGRWVAFADVARAANMAYTDLKRLAEKARNVKST